MPVKTSIRLRRGTASDWTSTNPVLAAGEPGVESDTGAIKIGDGTTAWTSLGYALSSRYEPLIYLGSRNATSWLSNTGRWTQPLCAATTTRQLLKSQRGAVFGVIHRVDQATTYDRIGIEVTTASSVAGELVRLGIYQPTLTGASNAFSLILDAGTVNTDSTGFKEVTISQALNPGIYVLVMVRQNVDPATGGNASFRSVTGADPFIGVNDTTNYAASGLEGDNNSELGALPATFQTADLYNGTDNAPLIRLRKVVI